MADERVRLAQLERLDGAPNGCHVLLDRVLRVWRGGRLSEAEQIDRDAAVGGLDERQQVLEGRRGGCLEALGVRLCRHKEQYIYEISLLRPTGRVIHVFTNAVTGQILSVKNAK